jgi:hypothetical protein
MDRIKRFVEYLAKDELANAKWQRFTVVSDQPLFIVIIIGHVVKKLRHCTRRSSGSWLGESDETTAAGQ